MNDSIDEGHSVAMTLNVTNVYALTRTELANDRTLLAYFRTANALFVSAVALIKLIDIMWVEWVTAALVVGGVLTLVIGTRQFFKARRIMAKYAHELIGAHPQTL